MGAIKKLFEHVEVPSPLPLRGQKTSLLHFHVTNFAVQVAKPSLKFVTNRKDENEQEEAWESKDPQDWLHRIVRRKDLTNQVRAGSQD